MRINSLSTNCDMAALATEYLKKPDGGDCFFTRMAESLLKTAMHDCVRCRKSNCKITILA
jgi:hypothetical protein